MPGTTSAPIPLTQIGGRHRAVQATDGTWTIFDVPVFAAFKDMRHESKDGKPVEYTVQFLQRVISRHQMRLLLDGYVAPVHVHHHGDQRGTRRIGGIVPRRVERRPYAGKPLDFLVADLVGIHPEDFSRIQRQEFPYPSVEIDPKEPEILSLALLSDEAPFFRHMLSIGEAIPQRLTRESAPAIAFRALPAGHARVLFSFSGGRRLDDQSKPAAVETPAAAPALDPALLEAIAQIVKAQIAEALGQQGEKPEEPGPVEMDSFGRTDRNFAAGATQALQDDIKTMRAELTTLRQEREAEQAIQHAADKIETAGAQVDKTKLRQYMAKGGKSYLDGYVEATLATHVATPPQWTGEFDAPRTDTPEVAKFATQGPDQLARARQLAHEYEVAPPSVRHYCSLAQYLANNVNSDAALICGATEEAN